MSPDKVAEYNLWLGIANFVMLVGLGIWAIRKVYAESDLASKRHREEVALSKDIEFLHRALYLLSEIYRETSKHNPMNNQGKLLDWSNVEINNLPIFELKAIRNLVNDARLNELMENLGDIYQNAWDVMAVSDYDKLMEHMEKEHDIYIRLYTRIYELIKIKTLEKSS